MEEPDFATDRRFFPLDRPQDFWREHWTLAKSLTLLIFLGRDAAACASLQPKSIAV
jgi:hypothetical protein